MTLTGSSQHPDPWEELSDKSNSASALSQVPGQPLLTAPLEMDITLAGDVVFGLSGSIVEPHSSLTSASQASKISVVSLMHASATGTINECHQTSNPG